MLLFFIFLSLGFAEQQTDQRTLGTYSIIGRNASIEDYPSSVGLRGHRRRCAGTLVTRTFILTAAHCQKHPPTKAYVGDTIITKGKKYRIRRDDFFPHPGYNGSVTSRTNDIALIKLQQPVELSNTVAIANIAEKDDVFKIGIICKVAAWGYLDKDATVSTNRLHEAKMRLVDPKDCADGNINSETELCLEMIPRFNETTAQGDSGASLWCKKKHGNGTYLVAGVDSRGRFRQSIFTKVSHYRPWIDSMIHSHQ